MEKVVVILDHRESFSSFFEGAKAAVQTFVHEKLLHKPSHEVGIVLFGCDQTKNPLFDGTSGDSYEHVTVVQSLETVGLGLLKTLQRIPPPAAGGDECSLYAALRVAEEVLSAPAEQKKKAAKRRIVVLSTFENGDGEDKGTIERLARAGHLLTLVCCTGTQTASSTTGHWTKELGKFVQVKHVETSYQLKTCFPIKENKDAHTLYSHTLQLGVSLEIPVKVIVKLKRESFPSLGNASHLGPETDAQESAAPWSSHQSSASGTTAAQYKEDDIMQENPVDVEERVKAFRFSRVLVPLSQPLIDASKLSPERGIRLVGFMAKQEVSEVSFMGTSKILCADKSSPKAVSALSSLAHAMVQEDCVAMVRMVLRAGASIKRAVGIPVAENPGYLILKEVPYAEDVSFLPMNPVSSRGDVDTALAFLDSNMLEESEMDLNQTSNPVLHRAMAYFTQSFMDLAAGIPDAKEWLRPVFGDNYKA